ncbi:unnamed protein product [Dovyalis caffra]|uniref:RING-type E3 ubiquitin transferase n=1 Tax=Dovyalis caffra TaxID=77055 RepID=A0AAV1S5S3_9ROSI|nr:unnamed protein product [Dovyalis caffra]
MDSEYYRNPWNQAVSFGVPPGNPVPAAESAIKQLENVKLIPDQNTNYGGLFERSSYNLIDYKHYNIVGETGDIHKPRGGEGKGQKMLNPRENAERRRGRDRTIAVAIDKDKSSQSALIWAVDNLVTRDNVLKLVHVRERQPSPPPANSVSNDDTPEEQPPDNQTIDLFLSFRCYCRRRQVQFECVLLEDTDVGKALIEYVHQAGVDTLLLGAGSRNGLSRLFKTVDIPGTVLKRAPTFCTVYVVSKGKVSGLRNATRPVPATYTSGGAQLLQRNSTVELPTTIWYDELSPDHPDSPGGSSERPSTDTAFFAFYENLGRSELTGNLRKDLYMDERDFESHSAFRSPVELNPIPEFDNHAEPWLEQNEEDRDEIRRLKNELKQTIDLYHAACKEALAAKQKAMELEQWKMREEKRIQEVHQIEETALKMVEWERAKSKAANEAAEAAQMRIEIEVQKRIKAEKKALKEAEERKRVLDALSQSHIVVKHQSLYHMIVVVFVFYLYFSVFK